MDTTILSSMISTSLSSASASAASSTDGSSSSSGHFDASPLFLLVLAVGLIAGIALSTVALKRQRARPQRATLPYVPAPPVRPHLWEYTVVPVPGSARTGRVTHGHETQKGAEKGRWEVILPLSARLVDHRIRSQHTHTEPARDTHGGVQLAHRSLLALLFYPVVWLKELLLTAMYGPDVRIHRPHPYATPPGEFMVPYPPQPQIQPLPYTSQATETSAHANPISAQRPGKQSLQVAVTIVMPGAILPSSPKAGKASTYEEYLDGQIEYCIGLAEVPWCAENEEVLFARPDEEKDEEALHETADH